MPDDTGPSAVIFRVIWRRPNYPVIIAAPDRLRTAKSLKSLARACQESPSCETSPHIIVIDVTGDEFWYLPDSSAITPGFIRKRWTKKRMIYLYNQSANAQETSVTYSDRSLGNKSLAQVVSELCALIGKANA